VIITMRRQLLQQLSDGKFHSGEDLGADLGLSRAAVWKHIQTLQQDGIAVESVHGKGYRLAAKIELLDAGAINTRLSAQLRANVQLEIFDDIESTNEYLLRAKHREQPRTPRVCLAERQSAGRGRRGRDWQSPYATSLAFSLLWRFEAGAHALSGLSLAVGVCVADLLQQMQLPEVRLKWPNDLLWRQYKIGGILIEIAGDAAGPCDAVIGIGLNISNRESLAGVMAKVDQPWLDLASIVPAGEHAGNISRNELAAGLIESLCRRLPEFEARGFAAFAGAYAGYDALYARDVTVINGNQRLQGTADGVDNDGSLKLKTAAGLTNIRAGEVSVRSLG
jgi:BirA family transcriptional regulator, biotin operon repressor / biotin---[acetyl-CoA-carboxylase] ligase